MSEKVPIQIRPVEVPPERPVGASGQGERQQGALGDLLAGAQEIRVRAGGAASIRSRQGRPCSSRTSVTVRRLPWGDSRVRVTALPGAPRITRMVAVRP